MSLAAAGLALAALASSPSRAQDACSNRGQLDTSYCDENNDLVADVPKDPKRWRDPSTLVWAYTPVEDPAVYANIFKPFTEHLQSCVGKRIVYYPVQSNSAEIEAMRSGRLHFAGFSTGPTGFAVNLAGAVPFAAKGLGTEVRGYNLIAIVKASSPFKTLTDLKGKKVAHTSPSSNSGNLAPRVLFPDQGLVTDTDYKPLMSGGHDKSVLGVASGDYDMAAVASDVYDRMVTRATVKGDDFRIIYKSPVFPTSSFAHAHDLKPELAAKLRDCFFSFRFTPEMTKEFNGDDRFLPITYKDTWAVVRDVAEKSGTPYNKAAYDAESRREAEAAAKKAQQAPAAAPKP
ncbi:phosphate/phosphite/phosphonate ABC transporter substrate-binding protein [Salinarimonas soli]|uniref:Phosphate/phosphite/phosphonate ABC transporter substrate-binding protein n=1 Tax=Salinarimonas soli TaxID=1638099 RepID=A0A5B2VZL5_9HYPH|nr:phosphate/phosphite/phosphonate ABC transporter substrate-binding protein [Salinarimonas soli]KAA2244128.1 phosphate/phosphite/phosphonate ABC transporter substrate-binding protein [Salinarimonas soli]